MRVVLDTSAIIYLNDFRMFDEIFTVSEVLEEVKDKVSSVKLSGINLKVIEPDESSVDMIKKAAKETGDMEKLSKTDIKILSAAKEFGLVLMSDDYSVQNVAEKLGIEYMPASGKKITKAVNWKKYCSICIKFYGNMDVCPRCGGELIRKRAMEDLIKKRN